MSRTQVLTLLAGTAFLVMIGTVGIALSRPLAVPSPPVTPPQVHPGNPSPTPTPKPEPPLPKPLPATEEKPPALPPAVPVKPTPAPDVIERVQVNGGDLADLWNVMLWKFHFRLPEERYTLHLWAERWTRGSDVPRVQLLASASARWAESDIVVKLPNDEDGRMFIRLGENNTTRAPQVDFLSMPREVSWGVLEKEPLKLDQPIHLVTATHNLLELPRGVLKNAHKDHDLTIYIKAAFTRGDSVPFEIEKWVPEFAPKPPKPAAN